MFANGMQKPEQSLIIVCDEKDIAYANYLIQLIGQKDDTGESVVGYFWYQAFVLRGYNATVPYYFFWN